MALFLAITNVVLVGMTGSGTISPSPGEFSAAITAIEDAIIRTIARHNARTLLKTLLPIG